MKRIYLALLLTLLSAPVFAQSASINAPVARAAEAKVIVNSLNVDRACSCANVIVGFQDASGNDIRQARYDIPADAANPGTELQTFLGALMTVRASETGVNSRKLNFRILGYLSDAGRLPGVTLVP